MSHQHAYQDFVANLDIARTWTHDGHCVCNKSGWILSDFDTVHKCPAHYTDQPHPEDHEGWEAYEEARKVWAVQVRVNAEWWAVATFADFSGAAKYAAKASKTQKRAHQVAKLLEGQADFELQKMDDWATD